jgi:hypothetical protein
MAKQRNPKGPFVAKVLHNLGGTAATRAPNAARSEN